MHGQAWCGGSSRKESDLDAPAGLLLLRVNMMLSFVYFAEEIVDRWIVVVDRLILAEGPPASSRLLDSSSQPLDIKTLTQFIRKRAVERGKTGLLLLGATPLLSLTKRPVQVSLPLRWRGSPVARLSGCELSRTRDFNCGRTILKTLTKSACVRASLFCDRGAEESNCSRSGRRRKQL